MDGELQHISGHAPDTEEAASLSCAVREPVISVRS